MIEQLWARYQEFCPDNPRDFLADARTHFVQRVWEMYLANVLLESKFALKMRKGRGPDIQFEHEGRVHCVEAIACTPGAGPDAIIQRTPEQQVGHGVPEEKLLLRLTAALKEKLEKYEGYRAAGIVKPGDACIIAISTAGIIDADLSDNPLPIIAKAVYPIGDFVIKVPLDHSKSVEYGFQERYELRKLPKGQSGGGGQRAPVPTTLFLEPRSSIVSCVFYSSIGIWQGPNPPGRDINVVYNLNASVPVSRDLFGFAREHLWVEGGYLQRKAREFSEPGG